jgi:hypothetical protein
MAAENGKAVAGRKRTMLGRVVCRRVQAFARLRPAFVDGSKGWAWRPVFIACQGNA